MRLLLTWAPVVLAPFVALIAFLSIAQVRTQADEARQAQIGFSQLEAALNLERARDWRAVATGQIGEEVLTQRRDARTHIRTLLRTLEVVADDENVGLVAQEVRSYEAALDSVLGLGAGFLDPEALDAQVVAPAFLRLSERLGEINEEEAAEAAAAIRRATLGTGASLSVATLLLLLLFWRFHHDRRKLLEERTQELSAQALQDSLTGLPNRRKLMQDLERALETATSENPGQLVMFDLDGFKSYKDSFGHPEGDLLLRRLGGSFATAIEGRGTAYRLGGDEFCALIQEESAADDVIRDCCEALAEQGEAFSVRTSFGAAFIPTEAATASEALRLADQRMYSHKGSGRLSAREQTRDLVLRILDEQQPILREHVREVASLARAVGERLGLDQGRLDDLERTAELHDLGKLAIPHSILEKNGPLDDEEWQFIRRHTLIGERMVQAAPALASIGKLIRSSHERFDGAGYPDGLRGETIPLASRIVCVCDAYEAMTSGRPYRSSMGERSALAELRRNAGTQFDPAVVDAFCAELEAMRALRRRAVAVAV